VVACDSLRACVAIPVHNHARTVGEVVRKAKAHASCVLVCDDGSTDGSGDAARAAGADVLTLPTNQGKGAALRRLFEEAQARGFRYAVALDADGQHDPDDLPRMAEACLRAPGALVCGSRDLAAAGAPTSSRFGRRFSNFWVWFESGARVEDSQCGFRAYPLPEALVVGVRRRRYDAEVEWLLRLAWAGVAVASVPVSVSYRNRVTHFRPFLDNARISLLNLLTCARLLVPWPLGPALHPLPPSSGLSLFALRRWVGGFLLTERQSTPRPETRWSGRSRGGRFGHWFFFAVIKLFGRGFAYLWLYPVALYFVGVMRGVQRASGAYLGRVLGPSSGWTAVGRGYRHFLCFAQTLVDRSVVAIRGPAGFTTQSTGLEHLREAAKSGKGAVLLTAHLGNWELASALLEHEVEGDFAIVAYQGEEEAMRRVVERMKGKTPRLISLGNDTLASLEILRSLRAGTLVAMQGDRVMGGPSVRLPFLGAQAAWPPGPFLMAALSGSPLISTFCFKTGPASYELMADPPRTFRFDTARPKEAQLGAWMAPYVARVEELTRRYPYQWFNFYDFWAG
jgi:predicted LPLAT superfamily acyltransferase